MLGHRRKKKIRKKSRYFRLPPNLAHRNLIALANYVPSFSSLQVLSFTQRFFKNVEKMAVHREKYLGCLDRTYLPTLPVFPAVSKFFIKSPGLPVRVPNLPDKMDFWASLRFSLKFSPFFHKIRNFCIHCTVSGTFLHMFSQWQRLVRHYNDESAFWFHLLHVRRHIMS